MHNAKRGVTLIEVMLASSIILFIVMVFFEGIVTMARISKENSELLAADAFAFDLAWCVYNQDYEESKVNNITRGIKVTHKGINDLNANWGGTEGWKDIPTTADGQSLVPLLVQNGWGTPQYRIEVATSENVKKGKLIQVDVRWGPESARRSISQTHPVRIFRANIARGFE